MTAVPDFEAELLIVPVVPSEPLALPGHGADLWRRLVAGPVSDDDLDDDERAVVREMRNAGIASTDPQHPSRVTQVDAPWLTSPLHELVYALVANVARERGIPIVFIKGPVLHSQGLREREHSGDVDVWVKPDRIFELTAAMEPWGWKLQPDLWGDLPINHSLTLGPVAGWGCEIDVHRRLPGLALSDGEAFGVVRVNSGLKTFAGVEVSVPRRGLNAALSALHSMRPEVGIGTRHGAEAEAIRLLESGGQDASRAVREIDALLALRVVLPLAFPDEEFDFETAGEPRDWQWRGERDKAHAYFVVLKGVPWRNRLAIAFRLIWPKSDVAIESSRQRGEATHSAFRSRLVRLKRGLALLLPTSSRRS